jgi:hypothetical protein
MKVVDFVAFLRRFSCYNRCRADMTDRIVRYNKNGNAAAMAAQRDMAAQPLLTRQAWARTDARQSAKAACELAQCCSYVGRASALPDINRICGALCGSG